MHTVAVEPSTVQALHDLLSSDLMTSHCNTGEGVAALLTVIAGIYKKGITQQERLDFVQHASQWCLAYFHEGTIQ